MQTNFNSKINDLLSQTKYPILKKNEILTYSNINIKLIDNLIFVDHYIIGICNRWSFTNSNITLIQIQNFISELAQISLIENKKVIGIFLSKTQLDKILPNFIQNISFNNFYDINNFYNLYHKNYNILINKLSNLLYENSIYFYEPDNSAIMLDKLY